MVEEPIQDALRAYCPFITFASSDAVIALTFTHDLGGTSSRDVIDIRLAQEVEETSAAAAVVDNDGLEIRRCTGVKLCRGCLLGSAIEVDPNRLLVRRPILTCGL